MSFKAWNEKENLPSTYFYYNLKQFICLSQLPSCIYLALYLFFNNLQVKVLMASLHLE